MGQVEINMSSSACVACPDASPLVLSKGRSFTTDSGTKAAKAGLRPQTQEPGFSLLGMNRCGSLPLLSAPHSLSLDSEQILKNPKRSQWPQRGGE